MKITEIAEQFQKLDTASQILHISLMPWYKRYWLLVRLQLAIWWMAFKSKIIFLRHPIALLRLARSYVFLGLSSVLLLIVKFLHSKMDKK
jgi:hypothetical protein